MANTEPLIGISLKATSNEVLSVSLSGDYRSLDFEGVSGQCMNKMVPKYFARVHGKCSSQIGF